MISSRSGNLWTDRTYMREGELKILRSFGDVLLFYY